MRGGGLKVARELLQGTASRIKNVVRASCTLLEHLASLGGIDALVAALRSDNATPGAVELECTSLIKLWCVHCAFCVFGRFVAHLPSTID